MRTTIDLDPALIEQAKIIAARTGRSFSAVIQDAVRESMARREAETDAPPVDLPVHRGGGLRPGVNLDDNASVRDLMDDPWP